MSGFILNNVPTQYRLKDAQPTPQPPTPPSYSPPSPSSIYIIALPSTCLLLVLTYTVFQVIIVPMVWNGQALLPQKNTLKKVCLTLACIMAVTVMFTVYWYFIDGPHETHV